MSKKNKIKKKLLSAKHERTRTGRKPVRGHSKRTSFKKANFFTPPLSCHSLSLSITTLPPPAPLMSLVTNPVVQKQEKYNFCFLLQVKGKI